MFIPVLKGSTEFIEKVKDGETIKNGCPQCQHDLLLKQFRVWGTLFLIPVFPKQETRFVYECTSCFETFDPAYRAAFINRAKYLNATPKEIKDLTDAFSLIIASSVLTADNRTIENITDVLKDFSISCRIDLEIHAEKFSEDFLIQKDLLQLVFEWYNICLLY
ncbi:MAG: hypothetical protein ABL872_07365, partial [Lacibacter sp.]